MSASRWQARRPGREAGWPRAARRLSTIPSWLRASAAPAWYQRAAHAGDFRGQAAWASVLVERGQTDAALPWLAQALANGSPSFLAVITPQLQASADPRLRALVAATG